MRTSIHPGLDAELEILANRSFRHESAVARILGSLDDHFVEVGADIEAQQNWLALATCNGSRAVQLDLRCVDSPDGLVTLIVARQDDVMLLLSAGLGTLKGRAAAVERSVVRMSDLSWVSPE
jgi:hypothetical protein